MPASSISKSQHMGAGALQQPAGGQAAGLRLAGPAQLEARRKQLVPHHWRSGNQLRRQCFCDSQWHQVVLSADHGLTWSAAPLPAHAFTSLAVNQDGQTIAVGYTTSSAQSDQYAGGALVSHDGGRRWQQVHAFGEGQACEGQVIVSTNAKGDLTYISTDCTDDYVYQYNRTSAATAPLLGSLRQRTYGAWTNADGDFVYALTYPDQYCSHDFGQSFINCADQHV